MLGVKIETVNSMSKTLLQDDLLQLLPIVLHIQKRPHSDGEGTSRLLETLDLLDY